MPDLKVFFNNVLVLFFFFISSFLFAQSISSNDQKKVFGQAEAYLKKENYKNALPLFMTLDTLFPDHAQINYKIGLCIFNLTENKLSSIPYFEKAAKSVSEKYKGESLDELNAPFITNFYLGKAYHYNYEFYKAIEAFQIFKLYVDPSNTNLIKELDRCIEISNNALEIMLTPVNVKIVNLGDNINSVLDEYSPLICNEESSILFTSGKVNSEGENQFSGDIYISEKTNTWQKAHSLSENINTPFHESTAGISFDCQTMFIYKSKGKNGTLYKSELIGNTWSVPQIIDFNQKEDDNQTYATISNERDRLYFVSDMPGGYGGKDIWMCKLLPNQLWGLPINLGPDVNSEYDEEAPFIHPDGKYLFFSSKGHKSMGGFDIFFVEKNTDDLWSERMNLGYPLNTVDDDVYYVSSADGKRSYFSSKRSGGFGGQDLYMATFVNKEDKPLTIFSGCVKHSGNPDINSKVTIHVKNIDTSEEFLFRPNIETGKYIMALNFGNYHVSYKFDQKVFYTEDIFVTEWIFNILKKDVELNLVEVFNDCIEPEVFLEKNKAIIKDSQTKDLKKSVNSSRIKNKPARIKSSNKSK